MPAKTESQNSFIDLERSGYSAKPWLPDSKTSHVFQHHPVVVDVESLTPIKTPRVSRSYSNMSVASQGPCHMVLHVVATPKDSGSPAGVDRTISFGI